VRRLVLVRFAGAREDFAAPVARFAVERFAAGLRAVDARLEPVLDDFARVDVLRALPAFRVLLRAVVLRTVDLRVDPEAELVPLLAEPSIVHLPDITRCAASATASAMIEPSLVALVMTLLAACDAVSAASSPASRILRRADGLALIAAAAAAKPAASISLLIAALASLSTVSDLDDAFEDEDFEDDLEEVLRADLAIALSPSVAGQDTLMP
jgi:hypothetical protein